MTNPWNVSEWPASCELCGETFQLQELRVRPQLLDGVELTYVNVCTRCYIKGWVINATVGSVNLPSESSIGG